MIEVRVQIPDTRKWLPSPKISHSEYIAFRSRFIRVEKTWSVTYMYTIDLELVNTGTFKCIQLFRERLSDKMCARKSQKEIWDMINSLFLAL